MEVVINLVKDFEGIIGALLGVIVTLVITYVLRSIGKIRLFIRESNIKYIIAGTTDYGAYNEEMVENFDDATNIKISNTIEIYNGSDIPKVLRNISYSFYKGKNKVYNSIAKDTDTSHLRGGAITKEKIESLNIMPKQLVTINVDIFLSTETIKGTNKIFIEMCNHKGKKIKKLIHEIE